MHECREDGMGDDIFDMIDKAEFDKFSKLLDDQNQTTEQQSVLHSKNTDRGETPLMYAIRKYGIETGDVKYEIFVNKIMEVQTTITAQNPAGRNALHYAAIYGSDSMLKSLMGRRTDLTKNPDNKGHIPISIAAKAQRFDQVKIFLDTYPMLRDYTIRLKQTDEGTKDVKVSDYVQEQLNDTAKHQALTEVEKTLLKIVSPSPEADERRGPPSRPR